MCQWPVQLVGNATNTPLMYELFSVPGVVLTVILIQSLQDVLGLRRVILTLCQEMAAGDNCQNCVLHSNVYLLCVLCCFLHGTTQRERKEHVLVN